MILLHGTTRRRAERILEMGPDWLFQESGSQGVAEGFSTSLPDGPFLFGTPEDYARGKANAFSDEGGPVILAMDVPEEIVQKAVNDWFPLSQGLVQFDRGAGLEELIAAWAAIAKHVRELP